MWRWFLCKMSKKKKKKLKRIKWSKQGKLARGERISNYLSAHIRYIYESRSQTSYLVLQQTTAFHHSYTVIWQVLTIFKVLQNQGCRASNISGKCQEKVSEGILIKGPARFQIWKCCSKCLILHVCFVRSQWRCGWDLHRWWKFWSLSLRAKKLFSSF